MAENIVYNLTYFIYKLLSAMQINVLNVQARDGSWLCMCPTSQLSP